MKKRDELKKFKPKNQEVTKYDFIICPNCGEEEVGKFCPSCGQSNKDFNKPLKEIFGDLLDSINIDIRLVNTIVPFLIKPGFLTQEYFKGRRKRYVPPMRMYILFSVLFFFLAQYTNLDDFKDAGNVTNSAIDSVKQEFYTEMGKNDSIQQIINQTVDTLQKEKVLSKYQGNFLKNMKFVKPEVKDTNNVVTFDQLNEEAKNEIIATLDTTQDLPDGMKKGLIGGLNATDKVDAFWSKSLDYISYALFLLMPVFAGILALVLWKSRKLYVNHLIFSINFHSFVFAISSIIFVLAKVLPESIFQYAGYLFWAYPLYLMFGIKRYYNRTYIGAFFKTIGIMVLYFFVLLTAFVIIIYITAQGFYQM